MTRYALTARVYVLTVEKQLAHMTRNERLCVSLHVEGEAASLGLIPTQLRKMELYEMLVRTTPQLVAFDVSDDGQIEMRRATTAETLAFHPPTCPSVSQALQAILSKKVASSLNGEAPAIEEQAIQLAAA